MNSYSCAINMNWYIKNAYIFHLKIQNNFTTNVAIKMFIIILVINLILLAKLIERILVICQKVKIIRKK